MALISVPGTSGKRSTSGRNFRVRPPAEAPGQVGRLPQRGVLVQDEPEGDRRIRERTQPVFRTPVRTQASLVRRIQLRLLLMPGTGSAHERSGTFRWQSHFSPCRFSFFAGTVEIFKQLFNNELADNDKYGPCGWAFNCIRA